MAPPPGLLLAFVADRPLHRPGLRGFQPLPGPAGGAAHHRVRPAAGPRSLGALGNLPRLAGVPGQLRPSGKGFRSGPGPGRSGRALPGRPGAGLCPGPGRPAPRPARLRRLPQLVRSVTRGTRNVNPLRAPRRGLTPTGLLGWLAGVESATPGPKLAPNQMSYSHHADIRPREAARNTRYLSEPAPHPSPFDGRLDTGPIPTLKLDAAHGQHRQSPGRECPGAQLPFPAARGGGGVSPPQPGGETAKPGAYPGRRARGPVRNLPDPYPSPPAAPFLRSHQAAFHRFPRLPGRESSSSWARAIRRSPCTWCPEKPMPENLRSQTTWPR